MYALLAIIVAALNAKVSAFSLPFSFLRVSVALAVVGFRFLVLWSCFFSVLCDLVVCVFSCCGLSLMFLSAYLHILVSLFVWVHAALLFCLFAYGLLMLLLLFQHVAALWLIATPATGKVLVWLANPTISWMVALAWVIAVLNCLIRLWPSVRIFLGLFFPLFPFCVVICHFFFLCFVFQYVLVLVARNKAHAPVAIRATLTVARLAYQVSSRVLVCWS